MGRKSGTKSNKTEYIKNLFLTLDPTSPFRGKMPAPKRKTAKTKGDEITSKRAALRAWMLEQKRNIEEKEEEPITDVVEDEEDAAPPVEEDGPLEDWTLKELKEECKTLGLSDKGKKADLIERIKEAKSVAKETAPVVEEVQEDAPVEEPAAEEKPSEETIETNTEEAMDTEEDAPLEDWNVKELKEECKKLGLLEKGKKADLIERIKEARAATEESVPATEATVEEVSVEETAPVEEAVSVEEETSALEDPPVEENTAEAEEEEPMEVEEDGPLEEWTVKELKEECKTLGLSDKGKKPELITRIQEARAVKENTAPVEEAPVEEAPVEEAPVEEAPAEEAPVEEAPVEEAPEEAEPVEETATVEEVST